MNWTVASGRPLAMGSAVSPVTRKSRPTSLAGLLPATMSLNLSNINNDEAADLGVWANPKGF